MEAERKMKEIELIIIPVPSTGHLLVHIEFAKRLLNLDHRIHTITILQFTSSASPHASVFARSLIASQPKIRLHDLPSLSDLPSLDFYHRAPEAYIVHLVKKATPLIKDVVSSIIASRRDSDSVRVAGLVLDFFCNSLIEDVGNAFNLPSYIFLTCSARYLGMMKYLPDRHRKIGSEFNQNSGDEELTIPGFINPIPTKFLPPGLFNKEAYHDGYVELAPKFATAKGILVNSFSELETHPFDYFSHQKSFPPVYPVGPILSLEDRASPNEEEVDRDRIMKWLEGQADSSVVYLCFGSKGSVDEPQVKEIAQAFELSGYRFLWSLRTSSVETNPNDLLPEGFMDRMAGKGLVCGWSPQVDVLAHKAIGGFVSHCGWNSTLESLWFGVPIATWPMYAEQQLNAFSLVKELGLAVDLRMDYVTVRGDLVTCDEILRAIRTLMDGGEGMRKKVKGIADVARKALMEGGSSSLATARFIRELLEEGSC